MNRRKPKGRSPEASFVCNRHDSDPAWVERLVVGGALLPHKPNIKRGMGGKACRGRNAPAPQAKYQKRHGWESMLREECSCPTSQISKEAGAGKLVKRQALLPDKPKHNEGRSRKQVVRDTSRPADPRRDPTKILNNNSNNKEIKTLPLRKNPNNQREFCNYYEIKDLHLC